MSFFQVQNSADLVVHFAFEVVFCERAKETKVSRDTTVAASIGGVAIDFQDLGDEEVTL